MNASQMIGKDNYLADLNAAQQKAVTAPAGPLLILAGAGTGKTKTLTSRLAHFILCEKWEPQNILAVTFTNKAAKEMKERLYTLIGDLSLSLWIGTFHSISARILRRHGEYINIKSDFVILTADDQLKIIKEIVKEFDIQDVILHKKIVYMIDKAKNDGEFWDNLSENKIVSKNYYLLDFYRRYQEKLSQYNALDFGDLILYTIKLMEQSPELNIQYRKQFALILVDEYQDTNIAQYRWLKSIMNYDNNICCVGDDDQSIYGWRGAVIENILRFEQDYPNASVICLEHNYRSTKNILQVAMDVIRQNKQRHNKILHSDMSEGEPIKICTTRDEKSEASYVAMEILKLNEANGLRLSDIAILMRAGYQTRIFEEILSKLKIPYKIVGGMKFYDRMEVRDAISYARAIVNPQDSVAFERIINLPRRGVGEITIQSLWNLSQEQGVALFDATKIAIEENKIRGKVALKLSEFIGQIEVWHKTIEHNNPQDQVNILHKALQESGYLEMLIAQNQNDARERTENIQELLQTMKEYNGLKDFIENIALNGSENTELKSEFVNIMTMHASKGLEFGVVFLVGWEDGVFPTSRSMYENKGNGIEEERRLAYVGITRAKRMLYITRAISRRQYNGEFQYNPPSCFLYDINPKNCIFVNG